MNKWENSFNKNEQCNCSQDQGLFVPNRQLSFIVAGLLFISFFIFMTGYFLGKKNVVEQFSEQMQQEACADQVYTSVLASAQDSEQSIMSTLLVTEADNVTPIAPSINQEITTVQTGEIIPSQEIVSSVKYYAQLIGFGTEKAAQFFVKKLAAKGIETEIKKHTSTTAKGRVSYWYQVVTPAYCSKDDLSELVAKITKEENIKGAHIRVC